MIEATCRCPVLRAAAEVERMMEVGLWKDGYDPVRALVIGRLRQEYGCRGPRAGVYGLCPWAAAMSASSAGVQVRPEVPLLNGNASEKPGQYL